MGKTDDRIRTSGASIARASSLRAAPPTLATSHRVGDPRRAGLDRSKEYWLVPLDRIDADRNQPRDGDFDREIDEATGEVRVNPEFQRLVDSLQRDGLLQPITLVHGDQPGRFKIHLGERRYRAALTLGWEKIPARIVENQDDPSDYLAKQIIENAIRSDLKPIEQARSFQTLIEIYQWSMTQLAAAIGYSVPYVSQRLKLLELPEVIQAHVENGAIDAMRGYHLTQVKDEAKQAKLVTRIFKDRLTVKETAEAARQARDSDRGALDQARSGRRARPKSDLVHQRTIPISAGAKVIIMGHDQFELMALLTTLEGAAQIIRAEIEAEREGDRPDGDDPGVHQDHHDFVKADRPRPRPIVRRRPRGRFAR
jgi:ParB family chromosome partitioning protein